MKVLLYLENSSSLSVSGIGRALKHQEEALKENGIDISAVHNDCGLMIFDLDGQDVHSGGSGCGCSASVVCSYILNRLKTKELNRVLFVATGALLSPTSMLQGESIPAIAHGVLLSSD